MGGIDRIDKINKMGKVRKDDGHSGETGRHPNLDNRIRDCVSMHFSIGSGRGEPANGGLNE